MADRTENGWIAFFRQVGRRGRILALRGAVALGLAETGLRSDDAIHTRERPPSPLVRFPEGWCLVGVILATLLTRAISFFYFRVRFDDSSLGFYLQFADPELLKSSLLETVFYLRDQPPLFNLFLGAILKAFPGHTNGAFHLIFLGCGLLLPVVLFLLLRRMRLPLVLSFFMALIFAVSPTTIFYENWLLYTYPEATLLCLSALFLHRYLSERRAADGFIFFTLLATILLMRGTYHLLWMLFIMAAVCLAVRKTRRQVVLVSLIPVSLALSLYVKNYFVFGDHLMGKMTLGANLSGMTVWSLPPKERERLIQDKVISPISSIDFFASSVRDYQPFLPVFRETGIAVLDQEVKPTGAPNWNHAIMGDVGGIYYRDAIYVLKHYPWIYWPSVWRNCKDYFEPAAFVWGVYGSNCRKLEGVLRMSHLNTFSFNVVAFPACALFAALIGGRWLVRRIRDNGRASTRQEDATGFTTLFCLFNIFYIAAVTVTLSFSDHSRYRFPVMPFYFLFFAMSIRSLWNWLGLTFMGRGQGPISLSIGTKSLRPSLMGWLGSVLVLAAVLDAVVGLLYFQPVYYDQPFSYWITHPEAETAVPALVEALTDPNADVRWKSAMMLGGIGHNDAGIQALARALEDRDDGVRQVAAIALGQIGPAAKDAIPGLTKALTDRDNGMRMLAARALGRMGPEAKEAGPILRKLLKESDQTVRDQAAEALKQIATYE